MARETAVCCQSDVPPFVPPSCQWWAELAGSLLQVATPTHGPFPPDFLLRGNNWPTMRLLAREKLARFSHGCESPVRKWIIVVIIKMKTNSNDCSHCTIVELPRGAALSLRQTQETLRLLDSCGANGNMCGLNTARVQPMEKSQMPSCRWIRPLTLVWLQHPHRPQLLFFSARFSNCAYSDHISVRFVAPVCCDLVSARFPPWHAYKPNTCLPLFCVLSRLGIGGGGKTGNNSRLNYADCIT